VLILDLMLVGSGCAQGSARKWIRVVRHAERTVPIIARTVTVMVSTIPVPCLGQIAPSQLITTCLSRERPHVA
jgi:hypothetical protein